MKKCKRYLIVLTAVALLLSSSMVACGEPEGQTEEESPYTAEELRQIEEHEFFLLYQGMRSCIEQARSAATGAGGFKWHCVADVGWFQLDKYRSERWTMLTDVMPRREAAQPVVKQCEECLALATQVWSQNPYKEPQSGVQKMEKLTIGEWRELCEQLESELHDVQHCTSVLKAATGGFFTEVDAGFSRSNSSIQTIYLDKFQMRHTEYTALLDEVMYNLTEATQALSELSGWQFACLEAAPSPAPSAQWTPTESSEAEETCEAWSPPESLKRPFRVRVEPHRY